MPLASLAQSVPMNDGGRNAPPFPDKRGDVVTIDHFLCFANAEGTLMRLDGTENYTEDDAQTMLDYVLEKGKTDGWYGSLQYFRKDYDRGTLVVFSDRSAEQLLLHKVLLVSILVFLLMEGVVFLLTMILTKRAMRPMQETFERQRQFISDAGTRTENAFDDHFRQCGYSPRRDRGEPNGSAISSRRRSECGCWWAR